MGSPRNQIRRNRSLELPDEVELESVVNFLASSLGVDVGDGIAVVGTDGSLANRIGHARLEPERINIFRTLRVLLIEDLSNDRRLVVQGVLRIRLEIEDGLVGGIAERNLIGVHTDLEGIGYGVFNLLVEGSHADIAVRAEVLVEALEDYRKVLDARIVEAEVGEGLVACILAGRSRGRGRGSWHQ